MLQSSISCQINKVDSSLLGSLIIHSIYCQSLQTHSAAEMFLEVMVRPPLLCSALLKSQRLKPYWGKNEIYTMYYTLLLAESSINLLDPVSLVYTAPDAGLWPFQRFPQCPYWKQWLVCHCRYGGNFEIWSLSLSPPAQARSSDNFGLTDLQRYLKHAHISPAFQSTPLRSYKNVLEVQLHVRI